MRRPTDNPFASRRIDGLSFRYRAEDIDDLVAALTTNGGRGAVIGPHGSGKTTLVENVADRVGGEIVKIHLATDTNRPLDSAIRSLPPVVAPTHTILLDGAEQLGPWSWWRVHRRIRTAGTIVITSHAPGRFPTVYECSTDPELLVDLVAELAPEGVDADLDELYQRHDGNIRLCFRELYDVWARS